MKKIGLLVLRAAMLLAAFVHGFPAWKHGRLFLSHPSLDEGWKAVGAILAIGL